MPLRREGNSRQICRILRLGPHYVHENKDDLKIVKRKNPPGDANCLNPADPLTVFPHGLEGSQVARIKNVFGGVGNFAFF